MVPEHGVVHDIGHYLDSDPALDFEPLRAFTPLGQRHRGPHPFVVPASSHGPRVVERAEEALIRVDEVAVDCGEVEKRNARFRE